MNPIVLILCVVAAVAAGWWVGQRAREVQRPRASLAGRASKVARRRLGSWFKGGFDRVLGRKPPRGGLGQRDDEDG